jgi:hypothetical protein
MRKLALAVLCILVSGLVAADSLRCGGKLVKAGESSNALVKKCGLPARKFSAHVVVSENGRQRAVSVSNWIYPRKGKKDMIASVRSGTVVRLRVDRS